MAEKTRVTCDACGKQFLVSGDLAGKKARCPCGNVINVPRRPGGEELARKWYYARQGRRYGPVPLSELTRLVQRREVAPSDYVWSKGMPSWKAAQEIKLLQEAMPQPEGAEEEVAEEIGETAAVGGSQAAGEEAAAPVEAEGLVAAEATEEEAGAGVGVAGGEPEAAEAQPQPAAATGPAELAAENLAAPADVKRAAPREEAEQKPRAARPEAAENPAAAKPAAAPASEQPPDEKQAAEPAAVREEKAPIAEAASKPSATPTARVGAAALEAPSYALAGAIALLLRVIGAISVLGGMVIVLWEEFEHIRFVAPQTSLSFVLGGLVALGVGQLLALARCAARDMAEVSSAVREVRGLLAERK